MDHQDWKTLVLNKQNRKEDKNVTQIPKFIPNKSNIERNLEGNDVDAPLKVSLDLKLAIQQARLSKQMTQKQLALLIGVTSQEITNYENGKAIPNNLFIAKLEKSLNCKLPRLKKK